MIRKLLRATLFSLVASFGAAWFFGLLGGSGREASLKAGSAQSGRGEVDADRMDPAAKKAMLSELEAQL